MAELTEHELHFLYTQRIDESAVMDCSFGASPRPIATTAIDCAAAPAIASSATRPVSRSLSDITTLPISTSPDRSLRKW